MAVLPALGRPLASGRACRRQAAAGSGGGAGARGGGRAAARCGAPAAACMPGRVLPGQTGPAPAQAATVTPRLIEPAAAAARGPALAAAARHSDMAAGALLPLQMSATGSWGAAAGCWSAGKRLLLVPNAAMCCCCHQATCRLADGWPDVTARSGRRETACRGSGRWPRVGRRETALSRQVFDAQRSRQHHNKALT